MSGDLTRVVDPVEPPVLLDEVRAFLRLEAEDEIALLAGMITGAVQAIEDYCRRALIRQEFIYRLDRWPDGAVRLPRPPLLEILDISRLEADGQWHGVTNENYLADPVAEPGLLIPTAGLAFARCSGLRIHFAAGYGQDWNSVPEPLRQAVISTAAHWFDRRETHEGLPSGVKRLIGGYRVIGL